MHTFVGRARQLAQLDTFLAQALAGRGQICFVTGDAGAGKTTLATEFMRQAQARQPDLVAAVAMGDPQTGAGDPYLIFREVLALLTGDVEARLAQGAITQEGARRLQGALRTSIDCLVEFGPDLIGLLVPGAGLAVQLAKLGVETGKRAGLLERLTQPSPEGRGGPAGPRSIDQGQIYEQYAKVLNALSQHAPLLLILDDLQWADNASIDLLFHLTRRIESSRICIIAMLRPAEIALGRAGERHPLERVMSEVKRYYGDVIIDLDAAARAEGAAFIDALLDSEPNVLGAGFRRALLERTGGNPLFAVELLREMEEEGALAQDGQGRWVEGPGLDWSALPARAEGVIESRISRLTADLLEALKLASVQGDAFTAEVVAQIRELNTRDFVRQLSSELEKRHRLVAAQGQQRVGEQRLSQYQFQNRLFQQYLYAGLDPTERAYLHEDIGRALEALYGTRADEIAARLAWHFEQAGVAEKARQYLRRAGEQAAARSAHVEAIDFFTRGLALTSDEAQEERFALVLGRVNAYHLLGRREAQAQDVAELERLAETLADPVKQMDAAMERVFFEEVQHNYAESAAISQRIIAWAQESGDIEREIGGRLRLAAALERQSHYQAALEQAAQAGEQAKAADLKRLWADSLWQMAQNEHSLGHRETATGYLDEARRLFETLGDRRGQARVAEEEMWILLDEGRYVESLTKTEFALQVAREVGDRRREGLNLSNLAPVLIAMGDLAGAQRCCEQAMPICREIGDRMVEGANHINLSSVYLMQGAPEQALRQADEAFAIFEGVPSPYGQAYAWISRGHALVDLSRPQAAAEAYQQALVLRQESSDPIQTFEPQSGLARVHLAQGDLDQALTAIEPILSHLTTVGNLNGADDPLRIYLTCYEVLQANHDPRATDLLAEASRQLQDKATALGDERARALFLANIPHHREIVKAATGAYPVEPAQPVPALTAAGEAEPAPAPVAEAIPPAPTAPTPPPQALPMPAAAPVAPPPAPRPDAAPTPVAPPDQPAASKRVAALAATLRRLAAQTALWRTAAALAVFVLLVALALQLPKLFSPGDCPPACAGADLAGRNWRSEELVGVDFSGAVLYGARLGDADLTASIFVSATLAAADLSGTSLRGANLHAANLRGANLSGADLTSADLSGAVLIGADLTNANLTDVDLAGANLAAANLAGVTLTAARNDESTRWPHGY